MSKTPTLAIDFGTSRTKVAYFDENRNEPRLVEIGRTVRDLIPSIFYVPKATDGGILVGDDAEDMIEHDPGGIVVALKKEIHKLNKLRLGDGRKTERIELASYLFRHIKEFAESHVSAFQGKNTDSCVLTVPVCFLTPQRDAIRQAAEKGGLRNIKIIEEPVAAARSWLWETHVQGIKSVIVCDIGGGTTDFAAVKLEKGEFLTIPEIPTGGFTEGGDNIDDQIVDLLHDEDEETDDQRSGFWAMIGSIRGAFKSKVRKIKEFVSRAKQDQFVHLQGEKIPVAQETVNRCISNFIDRTCSELENYLKICREKLGDEKVPILLVGGSSKLPGFEERVKQIAGSSPVHRWERSDYATVLGATLDGINSSKTTKQTKSTTSDQDSKICIADGTIIQPDSLKEKLSPSQTTIADLEKRYQAAENALSHRDPEFHKRAVKILQEVAEVGHAPSQNLLGMCYSRGVGADKDEKKAAHWLLKAAERGHVIAQYNIALHFDGGVGVSQDAQKAAHWFCKAAEQDDGDAQYELALKYLDGDGVKENPQEALKWLRKSAEKDCAEAQNMLGICYLNGTGIKQNPHDAVLWVRKAADKGLAVAQLNMGDFYQNGTGVQQDESEAVRWYRKAAEQGLADAQFEVGKHYFMSENYDSALNWLRKSASQGHAQAEYFLGLCYINGSGAKVNEKKGVDLVRQAAEQGLPNAIMYLGVCYLNGSGVQHDEDRGTQLIYKAAELGDAEAIALVDHWENPQEGNCGPCPNCGFDYGWNGSTCRHCKYPNHKQKGTAGDNPFGNAIKSVGDWINKNF